VRRFNDVDTSRVLQIILKEPILANSAYLNKKKKFIFSSFFLFFLFFSWLVSQPRSFNWLCRLGQDRPSLDRLTEPLQLTSRRTGREGWQGVVHSGEPVSLEVRLNWQWSWHCGRDQRFSFRQWSLEWWVVVTHWGGEGCLLCGIWRHLFFSNYTSKINFSKSTYLAFILC
jgi:hypothetical protein